MTDQHLADPALTHRSRRLPWRSAQAGTVAALVACSAGMSASATAESAGTAGTLDARATSTTSDMSSAGSERTAPAAGSAGRAQATTAQVKQDFSSAWNGVTSPDGKWRIAGDWVGTGGNLLLRSNARIANGKLFLTTQAHSTNSAEIQTPQAAYRFGYYEVRMKTANVEGVCNSFFWKAVNYGDPEIDIEFNTGGVSGGRPETWLATNRGRIHLTIHPWTGGTAADMDLPFNPSKAFHRYGFLWTPTKITFTVDGKAFKTFAKLPSSVGPSAPKGYILANTWTGTPTWGGGPPASDATVAYDWIRYIPNVTSIPAG